MKDRLYSVITVTWNNAAGLQKTIDSIRAQQHRSWQLIVIDGASTDNTAEILEAGMDVIDICISERDNGIYSAMNKGLKYAKGEYVVFMNAGDTFADPETLSRVCSYGGDILLGDTVYGGELRQLKDDMSLYDVISMGINHQSTYYRREVICRYGFDETYRIIADLKSVVEPFVRDRIKLSYIPAVLSVCEGGGMSKKRWKEMLTERQRMVGEVMEPFYATDYQRLVRLKHGIIDDLTVISQFTSLFPVIRILSKFAVWYNNHFKHIPL